MTLFPRPYFQSASSLVDTHPAAIATPTYTAAGGGSSAKTMYVSATAEMAEMVCTSKNMSGA